MVVVVLKTNHAYLQAYQATCAHLILLVVAGQGDLFRLFVQVVDWDHQRVL